MTHNISLDAKALSALADSSIKYMALLGPTHRKHQVIAQASLNTSLTNFPIASPAGLSIGGELPESIALSILSECHAYLNKKSAESMSDVLARAVENALSNKPARHVLCGVKSCTSLKLSGVKSYLSL